MSFSDWSNEQQKKKKKLPDPKDYDTFGDWSNAVHGVEEDDKRKATTTDDEDDIAPVRVGRGGKFGVPTDEEEERAWFKKSKGNWWETVLGSATDIVEHGAAGVLGIGEKLVDAGVTLGARSALRQNAILEAERTWMFNKLSGELPDKNVDEVLGRYRDYADKVEKETAEFVAKDLYDEEAIAKTIISDPLRRQYGVNAEAHSVFGEKSDALAMSAGQLGAQIGVNAIAPGSGMALMGTTAFGSEAESAFQNDADIDEAILSSVIAAGAEMLTEKIGGVKFGGKTLTDAAFGKMSRMVTGKLARSLVSAGKIGADALAEGGEELLSGYLGAVGQKLTYMEDKEIEELFSSEDALESFIGGVVLGGGFGVGEAAISGKDAASGLNKNEQAVVDRVSEDAIAEKEANGKKLTNGEKAKIRESVIEQMEHGQLDIDTIERTLGGKTYEEYKSLTEQEKSLAERKKGIEDEISSLVKTPEKDFTIEQRERLTSLREEAKGIKDNLKGLDIKGVKSRLSEEVFGIAKNTRLGETYAERARRGQAFTADLTKYKDEKQRAAVERAMKSGVLNNTYRAHQLVDTLSRLEADKGITFDYTNNAKLKESGFAVDGKTVNGYVKDGGVTLNVQSSKAWQTTVGHEITHVLEGTEAYTELQKALYTYAESKGELTSRKAALTELYKGIKNADIDSELTADLVGDYLFADKKFIDKLTGNRNLFQKVWDEVKYFCKIATGKELTEIEKVEREFARAWKEYGNTLHIDNLFETDDSVNFFETDDSGEGDLAYSISVTDKNTLDSLNEQVAKGEYDAETNPEGGYYVTYKSMSFWGYDEDGNAILRSPMAEYVDGELSNAYLIPKDKSKLNWYQSTETIDEGTGLPSGLLVKTKKEGAKSYSYLPASENQDLIAEDWSNLYFNLRKKIQKNGKWVNSDVPARYNPYEHSSNSMLNDQFTAAYQRDNLVTVKMIVPISEDNGAYRAQWSKDATGWSDWKSGIVAGKIAKQKDLQRRVYLSRYAAPVEIVPDSEVAQAYKGYLEGTDVAIPDNVVSPGLLAELKKAGVPIEESGKVQYSVDEDVKVLEGGTAVKYSLSTWTPDTQERVKSDLAKAGYEADKVDKWIQDLNGVASVIAANKDILDFEAADNQVMLKNNQDYVKTLDASTLCAKRLQYQGTFNAIQHRLPNTVLTSDDLIELQNMLKEHGYEAPCSVCYVESRRRHLGKFAQAWLDGYEGEYKPSLDEVTTSDGLEALRHSHPQVYKDFVDAMNAKGSANPKVVQLRTEYRNDIMSLTKKEIEKIEAIGGLRIQSFSDFETPHLLDMMQAVMDMSVKGLTSQAYTKVPNFAWVFGDTGIKINLSLIAEGNGLDADGNLIFSSVEGMDINEAMAVRDAYSENVGTIIVGANDAHILACMADDRIDYIIPFHRSGWGKNEMDMMGLGSYKDYSYGQNEHDIETGKKLSNLYPPDYWDYNVSGKENAERYLNLCAQTGREPKFSNFLVNNGDGSYSLQPDGSTDGYWKTLIDFKMYDNEGNGVKQQKVQPNFNMEEAYRVLNEYEGGANSLPVANDVVEEFVAKHTEDIAPMPDAQYSVSPETDAEYMSAVERGDNETAQMMVDEAARAAGYGIKAYHGTGYDFTVFDKSKQGDNYHDWGRLGKGFYFAPTSREAETWAELSKGGKNKVMPVYLKSENMLDSFEALPDDLKDAIPVEWEGLTRRLAEKYAYNFIEYMQEFGYNVQEILTEKGYDGINGHTEFVVFNPEQVKSADPITYDDNGNVIPLSERFNEKKEDIRFSLSPEGEEFVPVGNYSTPLYETALEEDIAPVAPAADTNVGHTDAPLNVAPDAPDSEGTTEMPPLAESEEDIIKTVKERLSAKITNSTKQLEEAKVLRDWVKASYDSKIEKLQALYDSKKNKDTKTAIGIQNRIANLKRLAADRDADMQKRISDIESRISKAAERMVDPPKKDILEIRYERIDKHLEADKTSLAEAIELRRTELEKTLADKPSFISKKAMELYEEVRGMQKGVRVSKDLGYLLDNLDLSEGHKAESYKQLRTVLLLIKNRPNQVASPNSEIEVIARELLNESYDDAVYELGDIDNQHQREIERLEAEAEKQKQAAREEAEALRRGDVREQKVAEVESVLNSRGFSLDAMLDSPKRQLSTLETVDTMPQRVMEKTFGYEEGQALADATVNKVAQNETAGLKWLDSITNRKNGLLAQLSKQYNIKPHSKEIAAAMMYGEGSWVNEETGEEFAYGDVELAKDFPDVKVQNNIKALVNDPRIRQFYDETLDKINEVRKRNGYPEIPKRANYYLHYREMGDFFTKCGLPFNPNDMRAKDLPTDMVGRTADLKPGQPFFTSSMQRKGKKTTYDLFEGMERYANSAKNQIYHLDDIQTFRALHYHLAERFGQAQGLENLDKLTPEQASEQIKKVYGSHLSTFAAFLDTEANIIAGKTSMIDRALSEGILGRRILTFMDALNKQTGAAMVGYGVSSANTNWLPAVREFANANPVDSVKALAQTVANIASRGKFDSFREDSTVYIRRKGADRFNRKLWQKLQDPAYVLMGAVDSIGTEIIARTEYNKAIREGMSEQEAHYESDKKVSRLMADRSLGQMPQVYTSRIIGLLTKFQLEVRNDMDSMFYDTLQEEKLSHKGIENARERNAKIAAKVAWRYGATAIALHAFGQAFESVAGYNPAFDIIEAITKAFGWDDDEESEDTWRDNLGEGAMSLLEDLPYASIFLDGGRIPISSALPDFKGIITGKDEYGNEKTLGDSFMEIAPYLLPAGGNQLKKTAQGLGMFLGDHPVSGSYTDSGNLRFPVEKTPLNIAQAALFGQYASKNAQEYFDNDYAPLGDKQIQEYIDVDIPIKDYWDYREGLSDLAPLPGKSSVTLNQKGDYIGHLDLPASKKNILINNIASDRKTPIDMTTYGNYKNFEEFDFAQRYPDKYAVLKDQGVSVEDYKKNHEDSVFIYTDDYSWAANNPEKYTFSKVISDDVTVYKQYTSDLSKIGADKDANGKSINGSRKAKVIDYINNLDADYYAKILLFKSEFPSDDTYDAEIVEHLNSRQDLTYEERVTILTQLGFRVENGQIYAN